MLTTRWTPLRYHVVQQELFHTKVRFPISPSGRRSGKTELAKRKIVKCALNGTDFDDPNFFAGAPTRDQAKRIFWEDLKALVPKKFLASRPSESDLMIHLINNTKIWVVGLDKPERIEGMPWDGGVLDEFGNMKEDTWYQHVRPALADRHAWCWFIGVPEGRNHYYDINNLALADTSGEWGVFHWLSKDILPKEEIEAAKRDLDELTYLQEFEGSFVNFTGRAYYTFDEKYNCAKLGYDPKAPLILCFDFNVAPGVAVVCQEYNMVDDDDIVIIGETATGVIGEVYVPRASNSEIVTKKLIKDWDMHLGEIHVYGDATGGAKGTAKIVGSDWDIVLTLLYQHYGRSRVFKHIPKANPSERARINAVNSRCRSHEGVIRLYVDPSKAKYTKIDFDGVRLVEGGSGEIDKEHDPKLTHLTDAIGYYITREFPVRKYEEGVVGVGGI